MTQWIEPDALRRAFESHDAITVVDVRGLCEFLNEPRGARRHSIARRGLPARLRPARRHADLAAARLCLC